MFDLSTLDRFQQYGQVGIAMMDAEVTRQAAMVAYLNDFQLMMWLSLRLSRWCCSCAERRPTSGPQLTLSASRLVRILVERLERLRRIHRRRARAHVEREAHRLGHLLRVAPCRWAALA